MPPVNRKELVRQYKQSRRPMGVFQIRNTVSGRVFVGASPDLPSMFNRLKAQLRLGAHPDRALQADWKSLGDGAFEFDVLDTIDPPDDPAYQPADDLRTLEELWRGRLAENGTDLYNPRPPR